jgi:hypothetical protein
LPNNALPIVESCFAPSGEIVSINTALQAFRAKVPVAPILTWAWVILTVTIAVYLFGESPLAGSLAFLSALAVFPPLYMFLARPHKRPVPSPLRTVPAAALFVFAMSSLKSVDYRSSDTEPARSPPGAHVLLDLVGLGDDDTDSFKSHPQDWRLEYVFQCWNFGRPGDFRIDIQRPDGSPTLLQGVQEHARSGVKSYVYTPGGSYRLDIRSNCRWRVKVSG